MPEIVVKADIGGYEVTFGLPSAPDKAADIDRFLDLCWRSIGRQKAKIELSQRLLALEANHAMEKGFPERRTAQVKARAEDRARLTASWQAAHAAAQAQRQRQVEFRLTAQQRAALEQHDAETVREIAKLDQGHEQMMRDRPIIETQISRYRAIIAGRDPDDFMPEKEAAAAA